MTAPGSPARRPAVVLLSGGLDSATTLHVAVAEGFRAHAISFDYGQVHRVELEAARRIAATAGAVSHVIVPVGLGALGGSALTDPGLEVPKGRTDAEIGRRIPVTYVPARNTVFLAIALAVAEVRGARDLFIGVNALDSSGYPDCRPAFLAAFEAVANLGTRAVEGGPPFRVHAPLVHLTKEGIVRRALDLGVDLAATRSCYDPDEDGRACGDCDACRLRLRGFRAAGIRDPAPYRTGVALGPDAAG